MFTWALVGSPNSGKTTLYNWLTGSKSKTVNYPGATIEYSLGYLRKPFSTGRQVGIVDTPGIYSFSPQSEDETVTYKTLFEPSTQQNNHFGKINAILYVIDATQLSRHLVLLKQLALTGYKIIAVLTMTDLMEKQRLHLNLIELEKTLEMDVILFEGILGKGLNYITEKMLLIEDQFNLNKQLIKLVQQPQKLSLSEQENLIKQSRSIAEKVISVNQELAQTAHAQENKNKLIYFSNWADRYLLHPIWGFVFFFIFMTLLFSSIYWLAQPLMEAIDFVFSDLSNRINHSVPGLVGDFLGNGLVSSISGIAIFIPQIFILSFGIGLLEATGYLARVAALVDKPLSLVGLGGRSFVPLLSGFACAIPALMATRNISSKNEKFIAQMIIPFMTCSARLPVFALLISFIFSDKNPILAGLAMAGLYFFSLVVGAVAASVLSRFIEKTKSHRLMMELPLYRKPNFKIILFQSLQKSKSFVFRAGPIILGLALVLWFSTNFPKPVSTTSDQNATHLQATQLNQAATQLMAQSADGQINEKNYLASHSYAARVGQFIEPIFLPLGVDWRVGYGLITAFAAREVFVSSLALVFNVNSEVPEEEQSNSLLKEMREARFPDGRAIFTVASVVGLMIFFTIALQCVSTFGVLKRETGSWKPALLQLFLSNLLAYGLAVFAVSMLQLMGF